MSVATDAPEPDFTGSRSDGRARQPARWPRMGKDPARQLSSSKHAPSSPCPRGAVRSRTSQKPLSTRNWLQVFTKDFVRNFDDSRLERVLPAGRRWLRPQAQHFRRKLSPPPGSFTPSNCSSIAVARSNRPAKNPDLTISLQCQQTYSV